MSRNIQFAFALACSILSTQSVLAATLPEPLMAAGEKVAFTVFAEGAQIYECKADAAGKLAWAFREPVATLLMDGKTIGRHYAGPHWEMQDGSIIQGKVSGKAPGATATDIPWLKLDVIAHKGQGKFDAITTIQRIDTKGGVLEGDCEKAGMTQSVAYSTNYVFLMK